VTADVLLPGQKRDLVLRHPWLNAAGTLGFGDECAAVFDVGRLGAFVTNPISLAPRTPSRGERAIRFEGGLLIHTGHPNPGLTEVLRRHLPAWQRSPCPVIVHLLARSPYELAEMASRLDELDCVAGIEVGLLDDDPALGAGLLRAARPSDLPILAQIPLTAGTEWAREIAGAGASALVLGAPRGSLPGSTGAVASGRLYGPAMFPLALRATARLAPTIEIPLLAGGGITTAAQRQAMLDAGAAAAVLDFALWEIPDAVLPPRD
jgi:dihydroorotate dehydrogenase (NAD+) catalytic subunit